MSTFIQIIIDAIELSMAMYKEKEMHEVELLVQEKLIVRQAKANYPQLGKGNPLDS